MKRKFVKVMFLGALTLSTVTYVGCKDYDDDIDNLQTQIDANKASIAELQKFVKEGKWVTNVKPITEGFEITFNNGDSYQIVNGAKGEIGETGKAGSEVTIDPKSGEWMIDKKGTGWYATVEDGHSPYISDGSNGEEKGYWYYWSDKDEKFVKGDKAKGETGQKGTDGTSPYIDEKDGHWYYLKNGKLEKGPYAQTSVYMIQVPGSPAYKLHISVLDEKTGTYTPTEITLPTADAISGIKVVGITDGVISTDPTNTTLYYGVVNQEEGIEFNDKTYKNGEVLTSNSGVIYAQVNPADVDFSKYSILLKNSKGETAYKVIGDAIPYEGLLTRAAVANGLYKLKVGFIESANKDNIVKDDKQVAYALATKDAFGHTILSDYNVGITASNDPQTLTEPTKALDKDYKDECNLNKILEEAGITGLDKIVDYKVTPDITDKSVIVNNANKTIESTKGQTVKLTVSYLKVDGSQAKLTQQVIINFCSKVTVANINWTVNDDTKEATAKFDDEASALLNGGATMTVKSAILNGDQIEDPTAIDGTTLVAEKIGQTNKYNLKATFDPTDVFEGNLVATLIFSKSGAVVAQATANITVNVNNEGVFTFHQKELYFTEANLATVYGTPDEEEGVTTIKQDLFKLLNEARDGEYFDFDTETKEKIDFEETVPSFDTEEGRKWITDNGIINVPQQYSTDNNDAVYSTRPFIAKYYQFGNRNLTPIICTFDIAVKSAIKEGKHSDLAATADRTLSMSKKSFSLKSSEFEWTDVYGKTITWSSTSGTPPADNRIVSMKLELDAFASQYIDLSSKEFKTAATTGDKIKDEVTVSLKEGTSEIVSEGTGYIILTVTDKWGAKTTVKVAVPIKP